MLQFTIRDLLLLTVIVALCVGWAGDRHAMRARMERLDEENQGLVSQSIVKYTTYQRISGRRDGLPIATEY